MYRTGRLKRLILSAVLSTSCVAVLPNLAAAEEDPTEVAAAIIDKKYADHEMDVKRMFASRCSWCHQGYGMKQADGPRLAGTHKNREELIKQIAFGKSPMPGFRKQLKPYQIEALADYILALPSK